MRTFTLCLCAALAGLVPALSLAVPIYTIGSRNQLFVLGDPLLQFHATDAVDGPTSLDETYTAGGNTAINRVDLSDGSVRLYTESTGTTYRALASAQGFFSETIIFDLGGVASMDIPFSVSIDGTIDGELSTSSQGSIVAMLGGYRIGRDAGPLDTLFGSTYSGVAQGVVDGAETQVSLLLTIIVNPSTFGVSTVVANALNSALFHWDLPANVSYTSASGLFQPTAVDRDPDPDPTPVPEPGTLALLGVGIAGLGFLRRRRAAYLTFATRG